MTQGPDGRWVQSILGGCKLWGQWTCPAWLLPSCPLRKLGVASGPQSWPAACRPRVPRPEWGRVCRANPLAACFAGSLSAWMGFIGRWAPVAPRRHRSGNPAVGDRRRQPPGWGADGRVYLPSRAGFRLRGVRPPQAELMMYPHDERNGSWPALGTRVVGAPLSQAPSAGAVSGAWGGSGRAPPQVAWGGRTSQGSLGSTEGWGVLWGCQRRDDVERRSSAHRLSGPLWTLEFKGQWGRRPRRPLGCDAPTHPVQGLCPGGALPGGPDPEPGAPPPCSPPWGSPTAGCLSDSLTCPRFVLMGVPGAAWVHPNIGVGQASLSSPCLRAGGRPPLPDVCTHGSPIPDGGRVWSGALRCRGRGPLRRGRAGGLLTKSVWTGCPAPVGRPHALLTCHRGTRLSLRKQAAPHQGGLRAAVGGALGQGLCPGG